MSESSQRVLILGSGVIGLTIGHVLAHDTTRKYKIKIVAREMSEDLDSQAFASPWAGANWSPIGGFNERTYAWEKITFDKLWEMVSSGLSLVLPSRVYYKTENALTTIWYKDLVRNVQAIPSEQLPSHRKAGVIFDTVSINPTLYLPWLKSELLNKGVEFERRKITSLDELHKLAEPATIVVNATGLGSKSLQGVEDQALYPIRGQTIAVHAPDIKEHYQDGIDDLGPDGSVTYIIPRPSQGGNVLLGGTYQVGNWDPSPDASTARSILERCGRLVPSLIDPESDVSIVSHNVGFRPGRKGGPRVELEWVQLPVRSGFNLRRGSAFESIGEPWKIVHAYGFGGTGYQNSWGVAEEVARLVKQ